LISSVSDLFSRFVSATKATFEDPRADINQTILVVAILTAALLVVSLVSLIAYFIIADRFGRRKKRIVLPTRELSRREVVISWAVFLVLLAGFYWSIASYSAKPSTCAMCHIDQKQAKALEKSPHKGIRCLMCHQKPGILGSIAQKIDYVRWVLYYPELKSSEPFKKAPELHADISDQSCLRCHKEITNKVVDQHGIRMRHLDVIRAGYKCIDCHNTVAHLDTVTNAKRPSMDKCISCHSKKTASNDCKTCHSSSSEGQRLFTREHIRLTVPAPETCQGCHNVDAECTVCHGTEMPHKYAFKKGEHARDGFLKKDVCVRCHDLTKFCNRCHRFPSPHQEPELWKRLHGIAAQNPNAAVYWPAAGEAIRGCGGCHSSRICDACHNDGRRPVKPGSRRPH